MKTILHWIDDRTGIGSAVRCCFDTPIPGGASPLKIWPGAILFCFLVQGITGLVMWTYYSPSTSTAWESVYHLQHNVSGGWLLRAVHHCTAQVLLVLIAIYMLQMIVTRAYRAPRELLFWLVVLMGIFCLCLMLTGDLLAWDLNSRESTKVRVEFLNLLPLVGGHLYKLATGGPEFGHATLTRFLVLHIAVFGGGFLVLWILHNLLLRVMRVREAEKCDKVSPFWPNQAALDAIAWVVVLAVVLFLALQPGTVGPDRGVELGAPADPGEDFPAARPEWAFRGLYEFSHLFPGEWKILPIFVLPGILFLVVLAMPWIGRTTKGQCVNLGFTAIVLIGLIVLSVRSFRHDRHDASHQDALLAAQRNADRVKELAKSPRGIPATGALTLMREDPLTRGPKIFESCACCHNYTDADGKGIKAQKPSAPNLYGFADRKWIAGLLDPKQIKTPKYFGDTKFRKGEMAGFVKDTLSELDDDEKEDIQKVVMALSAQAELKSQSELDKKDAKQIAEGEQLLADDWGCTDCHKFHKKGRLGYAPDLTGYGSREWLIGIIADPAHKRFYGKENDRMPAPAETLSDKDIEVVADWLRGEWYEPEK